MPYLARSCRRRTALASPTLLGSRRRSWSNCPGIILGPGLNQKSRTGGCGLWMDPVAVGGLRGRVHPSRVPYAPSAWGANPRTNASVSQTMPGLRTFVRWTAGGDRGDPSCGVCSPVLRVLLLGFSPGSGRHCPAGREGDSMLQSVAAKPISGRRGSPAKLVVRVAGHFGRLQSKLREDKLGRDSPAEGGCQQLHGAQSRETLLRLSSPTAWK